MDCMSKRLVPPVLVTQRPRATSRKLRGGTHRLFQDVGGVVNMGINPVFNKVLVDSLHGKANLS